MAFYATGSIAQANSSLYVKVDGGNTLYEQTYYLSYTIESVCASVYMFAVPGAQWGRLLSLACSPSPTKQLKIPQVVAHHCFSPWTLCVPLASLPNAYGFSTFCMRFIVCRCNLWPNHALCTFEPRGCKCSAGPPPPL